MHPILVSSHSYLYDATPNFYVYRDERALVLTPFLYLSFTGNRQMKIEPLTQGFDEWLVVPVLLILE
jgi:hypothetical protein